MNTNSFLDSSEYDLTLSGNNPQILAGALDICMHEKRTYLALSRMPWSDLVDDASFSSSAHVR